LIPSNGIDVSTFTGSGVLHVALTTGLPASGAVTVTIGTAQVVISYTSLGTHTLEGCATTGSGTLATGDTVRLTTGSLVAVDPSEGTVTGSYQLPQITRASDSAALSVSLRNIEVNPFSPSGDERIVVLTDSFLTSSGDNAGHQIFEFSYDAGTGDFGLGTPGAVDPVQPPPGSYYKGWSLMAFDGSGNLWVSTQGGGDYGFETHETHVFLTSTPGGDLPTLEQDGPGGDWQDDYPTFLNGDLIFGGLAGFQGVGSMNWDAANTRMLMSSLNGEVQPGTPQSPFEAGTDNLVLNGGMTPDTDHWNGFFVSTVTGTADTAFASGNCAVVKAPDTSAENNYLARP
jgi:hypothetical protein